MVDPAFQGTRDQEEEQAVAYTSCVTSPITLLLDFFLKVCSLLVRRPHYVTRL